tara:strand:+ start:230 stop:337 length:108 start_codon:yes stop_codon:yes gene_type:complete
MNFSLKKYFSKITENIRVKDKKKPPKREVLNKVNS